jgi:hypothetical protein
MRQFGIALALIAISTFAQAKARPLLARGPFMKYWGAK